MTKAAQVIETFLGHLGSLNIDGVASLFADDIIQKVPFAPAGTPEVITGKEAVTRNFAALPMVFKSMKYSQIEIVETSDDNFAVAFAHADAVLPNDAPYAQNYVFYVRLNAEGKISEYREYMNTQLQAQALAALAGNMD